MFGCTSTVKAFALSTAIAHKSASLSCSKISSSQLLSSSSSYSSTVPVHDETNNEGSSSLMLTEADVLARNQGELTMPSFQERQTIKQKQTNIAIQQLNQQNSNHDNTINAIHSIYDYQTDKDGFGAMVMEDGVVRINNVLSDQTATEMVQYVDQLLLDTTQAVQQNIFPQNDLFGNVYGKEHRWDLLMPLEASNQVMNCLYETLHPNSPLSTSIESILGPNATLYELSTMISDPGSSSQPLHPDIQYQNTIHPLLTCFIALQDIDIDMGPTVFMKRSATKEYHEDLHNRQYDVNAQGLIATSYNELGTLNAGDCSLYSAMTLHCGSANKSNQSSSQNDNDDDDHDGNHDNDKNNTDDEIMNRKGRRRRLFYFSFINEALFQDDGGRNYVSIRPEVKERELTLRDLQTLVTSWKSNS